MNRLFSIILFLVSSLLPGAQTQAAAPTSMDLIALAEEVAEEVEELRGWSFREPVQKDVYSEAELLRFLEKKIDEEYPDPFLENAEAFLKMIGALPQDLDLRETITEVLLNQVGGFYDPSTRSFYMIDRADMSYGEFVERMLVAHELTHALDDQYVDLDSLMQARERTDDGEFVTGSLVEGSATALMTRYVTQAQFSGKLDAGDMQAMVESEMERSKAFLEAPPYFQTFMAQYTCGMFFLLRGNVSLLMTASKGNTPGDAFLEAVADPPRSSEQILHQEKYWDPEHRDDPVEVNDEAMGDLVEDLGFRVTHRNRAGEIVVAVLTSSPDRELDFMAAGMPDYWTNPAASGWGGDRFYVLERKGSRRPGVGGVKSGIWITLWDTAKDRDEFLIAYQKHVKSEDREWFEVGEKGVVFLFGLEDSVRRNFRERFLSSPPPFTRGGMSWSPS